MESLYELLEDEKWAKFHIKLYQESLESTIYSDDMREDLRTKLYNEESNLRRIQLAIKKQIQYYLDLK